jgi:hypothetical protein
MTPPLTSTPKEELQSPKDLGREEVEQVEKEGDKEKEANEDNKEQQVRPVSKITDHKLVDRCGCRSLSSAHHTIFVCIPFFICSSSSATMAV